MDKRTDKFLVIGAGPCGLGVAKALKEAGILYEQAEADKEVGGNWYHGVYETAHIISSRKTTEYADFPMPERLSRFSESATNGGLLQTLYRYFRTCAKIFEFNTKVVMCLARLKMRSWEVAER